MYNGQKMAVDVAYIIEYSRSKQGYVLENILGGGVV